MCGRACALEWSKTHITICRIERQESFTICWMEFESPRVYATIFFHENLSKTVPFISSDIHHTINIVREYNLKEGGSTTGKKRTNGAGSQHKYIVFNSPACSPRG